METVSKLRFWCYKILPLVYDDSLSYYEAICNRGIGRTRTMF